MNDQSAALRDAIVEIADRPVADVETGMTDFLPEVHRAPLPGTQKTDDGDVIVAKKGSTADAQQKRA